MSGKKDKPIYKNNVRINSISGVNRLMQRVINALIQGDITADKAKAIGYLSNITLRGLEIDLEQQAKTEDVKGERDIAEEWADAVIKLHEKRRA